ncbi:MAG: hypothetical protein WKF57_03615 [Nakamurella sp.]
MTQTRHPSGVPTGGQFASAPLTEVGLLLSGKQEDDVVHEQDMDSQGDGSEDMAPESTAPDGYDAIHDDAPVEAEAVEPEEVVPGLEILDDDRWKNMLRHNNTGTFEFPPPPLHWEQVESFWSGVTIPPAVLIGVREYMPQARDAEIRRRVDTEFTEPAPTRAQYVLQKNYDKTYEEWRKRYSDVYWRVAKDVGPDQVPPHMIRGLIVAEMKCRQADFLPHPAGRNHLLRADSSLVWPDGRTMSNFEVSSHFGMRNLIDDAFQDPEARMSGKLAELFKVTQNMAAHIEELRNEREFRAIADSSSTEKEAEKRLRAAGFSEW